MADKVSIATFFLEDFLAFVVDVMGLPECPVVSALV